ncbi:MAG: hypothetical protein KDC54_12890, partial [Lewinella sp.]|nr:hypothetical protein [Lewinella sp.]
MKANLTACLIFLFVWPLLSQSELLPPPPAAGEAPAWVQLLYADEPDPGAVLDAFRDYYASHPFVKNSYTQYLKRWLHDIDTYDYQFREPGVAPDNLNQRRVQERRYLNQRQQAQARNGSWISVGPYDWDHTAAARSYAPGAAHVYTVEQCPQDDQVLYAGTATTGLWKSVNGGASWQLMTADLMVNQVYAIEPSHSDCQTVFAGMLGSIYRSTDGGINWSPTGDAGFQALDFGVRDIRMHPLFADEIWAATEAGLWRSTDGGDTWDQLLPGFFWEIEFHPQDPNTIYTVEKVNDQYTVFHRSTDGGANFTTAVAGWPVANDGENNENKRAEIAVTPADPDRVVALLTGKVNGGAGLYGIYVSEDAGQTWSFSCCGPQVGGAPNLNTNPPNINMMAWADDGSDDGGQYYYDLALAVSPTNPDHIFVAGVNMWVSTDGGANFICPAKWSQPHKANYVHADIHDIHYNANGQIWIACDGGIFRSEDGGASFQRSITGITGSDFWGFGAGYWDETVMIGGAYHNGTLLRNGDTYLNEWICTDGGDGVGGAVNPGINDQAYSNYNIKTLSDDRTVAPLTRPYAQEPSWTYVAGMFDQIEFAADCYRTHYFANGNLLMKTEDDNQTVTTIYDFGDEEVTEIEVAWSDPQVIYVATWPGYWSEKHVYRSTNGGLNWTDITPGVFSTNRHVPYDLEVDPHDPELVWLARVGRQTDDNNKIFRSTNGGDSWINISGENLAGEVLTNLVHQRGTNKGLYVGTTRTVYYRNATHEDWQLFASGLPASTRSRQLVINYRSGTLLNATNRSVWQSPLFEASPPQAQISVNKRYTGCATDTLYFVDHSAVREEGASWNWSFPGAAWVSDSTSRTPKVVYAAPGNYDVHLEVGDNLGTDQQTLTNFIEIGNECAPSPIAGQAFESTTESQHLRTGNLDFSSNTVTFTAWIKPAGAQPNYAGIIFHETEGAGLNFRESNELGYHWLGGNVHWNWSSGLFVPTGTWSFVAMVVAPTGVTFYLNDEMVYREIELEPVDWNYFRIGRYKDWSSRNFIGEMDEVTIWNRSLTRDEIRDWRHLTRVGQVTPESPAYDPDLLLYYQFNESGGTTVYGQSSQTHGTLLGGAVRTLSSAPVGPGSSSRMVIDEPGL